MKPALNEIDERTNLTASNKFELLLFRLGEAADSEQRELFGINVFKVREILVMPPITAMVNAPKHVMGVANIRGQIIPVIDLPAVVGCKAQKGLSILLVTEFARTTQAFAVEEVNEIVRLEWKQVLSAEGHGGGLVTSIARLDGDAENTRLAQVLDVEQILRNVMPSDKEDANNKSTGPKVNLPPGTVVLAADDSAVARSLIENGLTSMGVPYIMTKTGKEAWEKLQSMATQATAEGKTINDKVALMLTDLEMPEMDGFTLTRNIKNDPRFRNIPVVIHSSLTGSANEDHVRSAGADAYIAKFVADELATTLRNVLTKI
ncbi:MAG: chemotaxis protein [Gammaproteobacteria bacterium]|jgi:two-component system chemotaxis response regulator CheV|nr:chemotaxis protein [Gammaproteobacteria bacterium]MBU0786182.1 chemotaxis protein [Gammaproteobacteria bacterium]MBU0816763.1 chemotaxis protein [Gammaproteobacteria bacterium]MBU1786927.1 chemotaxis protein [Gammaproteobacteria bacterium]